MSATLRAAEPAAPVDLVADVESARTALRAVVAVLQGFTRAGHLSEQHAGQACRVVDLADAGLQRVAEGLALPVAPPRVQHLPSVARPAPEAEARASVLAELADSADGLSAGLELIGECCGSGDDRRVSQACRVAFTLASVAADLAMALSEEAAREAEGAPQRRAA